MKQAVKHIAVVGTAVVFLLIPSIASAHDGSDSGSSISSRSTAKIDPERQQKFQSELQTRLEKAKEQRQEALDTKKEELRQKLTDTKKKACENHQNTINRLMTVMDKRRQNAFDRITQISDSVQAFYTKKSLVVADYEDLVAKVNAAKAIAQTATAAQQAIPDLDCSGDHPRADVASFKEKRADSIDAMKAYRDAVKALVQAVKSAADATKGDDV